MGRYDNNFQAIDLLKFVSLSVRRAGHSGQLVVQAEIILKGNRSQRLVLGLDSHVFLGLDSLVQTVGPTPAWHSATCEFINDDNLVITDNIIHVPLKQRMGS
jgi:hypothetical protein